MLFVFSYLSFVIFYLSFLFLVSISIISHCFHFVLNWHSNIRPSMLDERNLDSSDESVLKPFNVISTGTRELHVLVHPFQKYFSEIFSPERQPRTFQGDEEWRIVHWGKLLAPGKKRGFRSDWLKPKKNLSHVSPENFLGATLGENEFQSIFKTNFGWLASTEDQIAGHLKAPHCHNYYHNLSLSAF